MPHEHLDVHLEPKAFCAKLRPIQFVLRLHWCIELLFSKGGTGYFTLLNVMRFLLAHFFSLARSP